MAASQPEVNLSFTRQYRLLLAPPRALPTVLLSSKNLGPPPLGQPAPAPLGRHSLAVHPTPPGTGDSSRTDDSSGSSGNGSTRVYLPRLLSNAAPHHSRNKSPPKDQRVLPALAPSLHAFLALLLSHSRPYATPMCAVTFFVPMHRQCHYSGL
jgi:hypothetical protein